jgi:hypothetical protein
MSFSSRSVGTSPAKNFQPYGWHDEDDVAHVYGCALDDDGNLWRLRTYWGFPSAAPPYDVVLDRENDDGLTVGTFGGDAVMCEEADCGSAEGSLAVLTTRPGLNPNEGEGRVTEWRQAPTSLKAEVTAHPSNAIADSDTFITVDVTWPE